MTTREAAEILQSIRSDKHDYDANHEALAAKVDSIGSWAAQQKQTPAIRHLLQEASLLHDVLCGGSGRIGRVEMF